MRLPTGGGVAQGELDAMQLEIDQTGAGPLVAAPPAGSVAAEAYGWFCLGDWGIVPTALFLLLDTRQALTELLA